MFFRETLLKKVLASVVVFIYVLSMHLFVFPRGGYASQIICYMPNGPIRSTPQYNPQSGFCETWPLDEYNTCPERYTYSQWLGTCIDLPRCTGTYTYDLGSKSCVPVGNQTQEGSGSNGTTQYDNICAIDLNGDGEITEDELAQCITTDDGSKLCPLDAAPCRAKYATPDCPQGYTYNGTRKTCQSNPTCESGFTYDGVNKVCKKDPDPCPNGGVLQNINGQWKCVATGNSVCPEGSTTDPTRGVCLTQPSDWKLRCAPGLKFLKLVYGYSKRGCPTIYSINSKCYPGLTINGEKWDGFTQFRHHNACDLSRNLCGGATGLYYITPGDDINQCTYNTCQPYLCFSSSFDGYAGCTYQNVCIYPLFLGDKDDDGLYYFPPKKGDPLCAEGQYLNSQTGMCEFCPSGYTYDPSTRLCLMDPCPSGSTYNSTLQACVKGPSCIRGGSFNQSIGKCEGSASCPSGATLTSDGCFMGYYCPYGNYPCKPVNGVMMCSANQCLTTSQLQSLEEDDPDEPTDYQDDGEMDSAGQCLGQVYIFNGQKHRCRPSGWKTGFQNCCSSKLAKNKIYDSTGSTGATFALLKFGADAIRHAYDMVQFGYLFAKQGDIFVKFTGDIITIAYSPSNVITYNISQNPKIADALGKMITDANIYPNDAGFFVLNGGDQTVANAMASYASTLGPTMALAITHLAISGLVKDPQMAAILNLAADGVFFYLFPGLMSPVGLAVAVITTIASFFMGGGCDKEDVITVTEKESGRCHYVGTRCIKKLKLGPIKKCIQKAKYYCCFNSKLARIIHEQGRPQLITDIRNWGSAESPNCRGFTPEEFASLDFDKIDLSEYFEDITRNVSNNVDIQTHVQEYFYGSVGQKVSN